MTPDPIDVRQLARSIRFAFVAIVVGLSYFSVRASLSIDGFSLIFRDMLGSRPLPVLTTVVIGMHSEFLEVSLLIPAVAIATLFQRRLVWSFYILGSLAFVAIAEFIVLYHGLSAPLGEILRAMGGDPGR